MHFWKVYEVGSGSFWSSQFLSSKSKPFCLFSDNSHNNRIRWHCASDMDGKDCRFLFLSFCHFIFCTSCCKSTLTLYLINVSALSGNANSNGPKYCTQLLWNLIGVPSVYFEGIYDYLIFDGTTVMQTGCSLHFELAVLVLSVIIDHCWYAFLSQVSICSDTLLM